MVASVDVHHLGILYKDVCHVSKHKDQDGKRYPMNHGHQGPEDEQYNVGFVCEPELHSHTRERESGKTIERTAEIRLSCRLFVFLLIIWLGGRILNYAIRTRTKL